ncbi:NAD-dependent deacetylase [Prosthecobacter fusiformis]|uniref:NAD-dependent protein deacylase n=1 Tax=Prosthecobacter fusiformis TaxID=48464 RepID=A0A4R7RYL4_9BACT|nr:NAD-dependent deacylase [Prosthecobacter fusiformis]TDU70951.1 NAD-dependent deacetylase [Prosthecobacter fusiformis]
MAGLTHPNLIVLTGAGLSAESGVPTFRGVDGLWEGHRIEEVASPEAYKQTPHLVHRFYNLRRAALKTVEPNAAHYALVRLEKEWPGAFLHVTQNVDDLNERAGAKKLLHMHGQLKKIRCVWCRNVMDWEADLDVTTACPECATTGKLRPDIVWFGEMPYHIEEVSQALETVDIFVCIGTSGVVYPAAGFARQAATKGAKRLIEVNLEPTEISGHFTEQRQGTAGVEVPRLVEELLAQVK